MKYYGVHVGRKTGVFTSWAKVKPLIEGFSGAQYKSFALPSEAEFFSIHGTVPDKKAPARPKSPELPDDIIADASDGDSVPVLAAPIPVPPTLNPATLISKYSKVMPRMPLIPPSASAITVSSTGTSATEPSYISLMREYLEFKIPDRTLYIYTDGSTVNNGKSNARGGYGVFFSDPAFEPISKALTGKATNNIAELTAIIKGLEKIVDSVGNYDKIVVHTDSEYSFLALAERYKKWETSGWQSTWKGKTQEIKNQDLIKRAYQLYNKTGVQLKHVRAHTGKKDIHSIGNEIADRLAEICYRS